MLSVPVTDSTFGGMILAFGDSRPRIASGLNSIHGRQELADHFVRDPLCNGWRGLLPATGGQGQEGSGCNDR